MPVPLGPLSPELEQRIISSIRELFKAEKIDPKQEAMIVRFAPIMAVSIYGMAGKIQQEFKLTPVQSERLALVAMKAAVIQVSIYQELESQ